MPPFALVSRFALRVDGADEDDEDEEDDEEEGVVAVVDRDIHSGVALGSVTLVDTVPPPPAAPPPSTAVAAALTPLSPLTSASDVASPRDK